MSCKYCGRTKQTPQHKACDGCGAEVKAPAFIPTGGPLSEILATMSVAEANLMSELGMVQYGIGVMSPRHAVRVLNA